MDIWKPNGFRNANGWRCSLFCMFFSSFPPRFRPGLLEIIPDSLSMFAKHLIISLVSRILSFSLEIPPNLKQRIIKINKKENRNTNSFKIFLGKCLLLSFVFISELPAPIPPAWIKVPGIAVGGIGRLESSWVVSRESTSELGIVGPSFVHIPQSVVGFFDGDKLLRRGFIGTRDIRVILKYKEQINSRRSRILTFLDKV